MTPPPPWQFYNDDASATVALNKTAIWTEDWLGLRQLHETGRLGRTVAPDVCHTCWVSQEAVFDEYIAPYLPEAPVR